MNSIVEIIKNDGWIAIFVTAVGLIYNYAFLLYSNRADRLRFTPKLLFKRLIALNLSLSIIGSLFYGLFMAYLVSANYNQVLALILFAFIIYIVFVPIVNLFIGYFTGTYHYIIDSNGEKIYIQRKTFDDKILLSNTPDMYFAEDEGTIRFEHSDYLDDKTIHFITKHKYSKDARAARREIRTNG